jgi:hypothetical protein
MFSESLVIPRLGALILTTALTLAAAGTARAEDRYALVVSGASGGAPYGQKYDAWRAGFVKALVERLEYPADHVRVLAENGGPGVPSATRENVRTALAAISRQAKPDDVVLVLLIGHGSGMDGDEAKFNLVGPDLSAAEWAALVKPIAAHLVFVNTASGSFPFLDRLSARGRIVLTANDTAAQQYENVFPEFLLSAISGDSADLDKNGKVSVWEAFVAASDGVRRYYEERGQLMTERAMLDDTGDAVGREAGEPGADGPLSQLTYLRADRAIPETGDAEMTSLLRRRGALEKDLEALGVRKPTMDPQEYERALEKILLEIAQIDRRIRSKS